MNAPTSLAPHPSPRTTPNSCATVAECPPGPDERATRLDWVFRDYPDGLAQLLSGRIPAAPLQVEIHPYHHSQPMGCNNLCGWCTRLGDKCALKAGAVRGIEPVPLLTWLRSLRGTGVRRVVVSGNSTEPLLYPWIVEVLEAIHAAGLPWVLFSNFYYGETILDAATRFALPGSMIRVSLDAFTARAYDQTHRPQTGPGAFEKVTANIEKLALRRVESGSPLRIGLAYLLVEANSDAVDLQNVMAWADRLGLDSLRFSVPLQPTHQNGEFALAERVAAAIKARATALIDDFQRTQRSRLTLSIRQDPVHQPPKTFARCHHGRAIPVLGVRGKLYPCTSTSIADFDELGLGDINDPAFDFWSIWRDPAKWQHDTARCPDCTRFEFDFNAAIEERLRAVRVAA